MSPDNGAFRYDCSKHGLGINALVANDGQKIIMGPFCIKCVDEILGSLIKKANIVRVEAIDGGGGKESGGA